MKKLLISLGCALLFTATAWAEDFSAFRRKIAARTEAQGTVKLALIFETQGRSQLKTGFNLVQLKKDMAKEMLRSFQVADPVITAEILRKNHLSAQELKQDPVKMRACNQRNGSNRTLIIELKPYGEGLSLKGELYDRQGRSLGVESMEVARQKKQPRKSTAQVYSQAKAPQKATREYKVLGQSMRPQTMQVAQFADEFIPRSFRDDQNNSWIDWNPTALMSPTPISMLLQIWLKNLTDVKVPAKSLFMDWRALENLQFSYQVNTNIEAKSHSSYLYAKLMLVDAQEVLVSFGGRKRITWNKENLDFVTGNDTLDKKNDGRNKNSLFLAVTGRLENLGLMANAYIDNQRIGLGAKYMITEELKVFVDSYQNYYEKPLLDNDASLGVQFSMPTGAYSSLKYEMQSEQVHLGIGFSY